MSLSYQDKKLICKVGTYENSPCMSINFYLESGEHFAELTKKPSAFVWFTLVNPCDAVINLENETALLETALAYFEGKSIEIYVDYDITTDKKRLSCVYRLNLESLSRADSEGVEEHIRRFKDYFKD